MPNMQEILSAPRDLFNVRRVFGEPIARGDVTVGPVASISGGGGGGQGQEAGEGETGEGGGFGGTARPVGVYVIEEDHLTWQPSLDVTRLGVLGIALAALMTLVVGSAVKRYQLR